MYGLVNKAIEDLVCDRFGCEAWLKIKEKANVKIDNFIGMDHYDDQITYDLVAAASESLGMCGRDILEAFGEYWILYTAREGYKEMLDLAGSTFVTFLQNLDALHTHIGSLMPNLQPPSFSCSDVTENSLLLHYYSHRKGLAPMVIGLLQGLGKRFSLEVVVTLTQSREQGADHDIFSVTW
ncbi:heme NO-binding domain-containing protein [Candidatus Uabimicrobium amorphum]|uniref:Heme NO-binding domain-containing protein n=1 Tax=Uabimicrobium amorphum TaxID=2596890 RepID=A0A5S9F5J3_UABAM|nr:heme NO-binding domain-containing protein [Candidatus Uabimicrobium amorphum]BBM86917.1 hypothetical protein UABAM_05319 [Candidatus Uabimicrobium amorphum]